MCSESKQALLDYPSKPPSSLLSRQTTRVCQQLTQEPPSRPLTLRTSEYYSYMWLCKIYSFQHACMCTSCSLFAGPSVYSERFWDNLPGLAEPSAAAIPDCFGGVSINRESDARRSVSEKQHTPPHAFFTPRQPADTQRFGFWKLDLEKKISWICKLWVCSTSKCHCCQYFFNNYYIFHPVGAVLILP